jgi:hypothetical protein
MTHTTPIVKFGSVIFTGTSIKSAKIVEEFDPLNATLPINTLELILYSTEAGFMLIDPTGDYALLENHQPMVVYEESDTQTILMGQYYLDTWENISDTLIKFNCIDLLGILDKSTYYGGIWLTPIAAGDLFKIILDEVGVPFAIDPDLYSYPLTGWIPICTYREALQQIAMACGASIFCARQSGYLKIGKMYMSGAISKGPRAGVSNSGQSRVYQQRWRFSNWDASYSSVQCGISGCGQSRNYQRRWRPCIWVKLIGDITITKAEKGLNQSLSLRDQVTGIEVTAHDIVPGLGSLELYKGLLSIGSKIITFKQPMHDLNISGATITESGANYAIINVANAGLVVLTGLVYIDTRQVFSKYMTGLGNDTKVNVLKITDASLVNSVNAAEVTERIYNYYQQRLLQKVRLYAPVAASGNVVIIDTLYDKKIRGIINKMSIDLSGGFIADTEIVGVVSS